MSRERPRRKVLFSRLAVRVFTLFVLCALVPVGSLALLSLRGVNDQLYEHGRELLGESTKGIGQGSRDRLLVAEANLSTVASQLSTAGTVEGAIAGLDTTALAERFDTLTIVGNDGQRYAAVGSLVDLPILDDRDRRHLLKGRTLLASTRTDAVPAPVFLVQELDADGLTGTRVWGRIAPGFIWGLAVSDVLPRATSLCVLEAGGKALFCSFPGTPSYGQDVVARLASSPSGNFAWSVDEAAFLASYWAAPLEVRFGTPDWTYVLSKSERDLLTPTLHFQRIFLLVIVLCFSLVLLLSIGQIRRTPGPVRALHDGARRIAAGDFSTRVRVGSDDEFEDLATSFNSMAEELGERFETVSALAEVDRAVLSTLDVRTIADTIVRRLGDVFPCDGLSVTLLRAPEHGSPRAYLKITDEAEPSDVPVVLGSDETKRFGRAHDYLCIGLSDDLPGFLAPLRKRGIETCWVFPIEVEHELVALMTLGYRGESPLRQDTLERARQFADRVGVAMSNAMVISEQRALEDQLRQSQKLEAIAQLAGGVAHDFNNLLTGLKGYLKIAMDQLAGRPDVVRDLVQAEECADRAADLTLQLLAFSRRQPMQRRIVDLNALVEETYKMLRRLIGENIELQVSATPELAPVRADPAQLAQVMINLAVNARDAMPRGGRLQIETGNVELTVGEAEPTGLSAGSYVALRVLDDGCGMDPQTRERAFEPFFTTKGPGHGTGLGLSTAYGIAKQLGGDITIESAPGRGTRVQMLLPKAVSEREEPAVPTREPEAPSGWETVLLVEDEDVARHVARRVLEQHGYQVLSAADVDEAERLFDRNAPRIAMLLTDVVMPGGDGFSLYERLIAKRPDLKAAFMSGYPDHALDHGHGLGEDTPFVQKPFSPKHLARMVRETLDR